MPADAPEFVREVTAPMLEGRGDEIPVSLMPVDGTWPSGTAVWEKRNIAEIVPVWDEDLCIQCGQCSFVCPHGVIQAKYFDADAARATRRTASSRRRSTCAASPTCGSRWTSRSRTALAAACASKPARWCPSKSLVMQDKEPLLAASRTTTRSLPTLPVNDRARVDFANVRGVQFLEPLFTFSGACAGCGETPYLKLLSQLFGDRAADRQCDRLFVDLWRQPAGDAVVQQPRGPRTGLVELAVRGQRRIRSRLPAGRRQASGPGAARCSRAGAGARRRAGRGHADRAAGAGIRDPRAARPRRRTDAAAARHRRMPRAKDLLSVVDHLVRRSIWIVGGDGWAYDIGYGGLDHVLASARDVNVLVLDTEVYSNTGGQASKATPLGAIAKFAAAGKRVARKDLALQAIAYGNVYVAQVAMGANPQQTLQAFREAEAYPGPSLILAYCHCIAHGIDMQLGHEAAGPGGGQRLLAAVPLQPGDARSSARNPFVLDSPRPTIRFRDYAYNETRYRALAQSRPEEAEALMAAAQAALEEKYRSYEEMAGWSASRFHPAGLRNSGIAARAGERVDADGAYGNVAPHERLRSRFLRVEPAAGQPVAAPCGGRARE